MQTRRTDKSCHKEREKRREKEKRARGVKVGRVTPLRVNYGARQTSRLGDHYREIVRIARHRRCSPVRERGIGFRDAKIRVRGGEPVIRELVRDGAVDGTWWIHVVLHLSDNLTTARLSRARALSRAPRPPARAV